MLISGLPSALLRSGADAKGHASYVQHCQADTLTTKDQAQWHQREHCFLPANGPWGQVRLEATLHNKFEGIFTSCPHICHEGSPQGRPPNPHVASRGDFIP